MRYDIFMIWGNGLTHFEEINDIINHDPNFEVLSVHEKKITNMETFIQDVYKCDTVPWVHLIAKSKYLLNSPPSIIYMVVQNKDPDEKIFGEGEFKHIQCTKVKSIKEIIRNKFNPKVDGKRSEEHVIHATDYEKQTEYLLDYFGLPNIEKYNKYENSKYVIPYHLSTWHGNKIQNTYEIKVNLNELTANIVNKENVLLKDTPHYKYVKGDKSPYIEYYNSFFSTNLTDNHHPITFDKMVDDFEYPYNIGDKKSLIIVEYQNGIYKIKDGIHRSVIMLAQGYVNIEALCIMPLIDIPKILHGYTDAYCINKMSEVFPNYSIGNDIDIICDNRESLKSHIIDELEKNYDSEIKIEVTEKEDYCHIDAYAYVDSEHINLRFDLIDKMNYKKFDVKIGFIETLLKSTVEYKNVLIPDIAYDLALRYMEYAEYKDDREDKIKHLHYVEKSRNIDYKAILTTFTNLDMISK